MNDSASIIMYVYGLVWLIVIIIVIFLIIKRLKNRKSETFEKRDN